MSTELLHSQISNESMANLLVQSVFMKPDISVSYCLFRRDLFSTIAIKGGGISVLLIALAPAFADQFDTVNYIADAGVNYDDNIFRLPDGADPATVNVASKSDLIRSASLGINIDKKYSNQEVIFNAIGTDFKYRSNINLDYTGSSFKGAWNWQISPRLSGNLNATRAQTLNNPADTAVYTRNLNTADNLSIYGDWWADSNWHMLFGISDGKTTNSINTINNQSYRNWTNEWGVKYDPADGKSVALISRNLRGGNSGQVTTTDTSYTETQQELRVTWQFTGKSALSANLMNIDHRYPDIPQRDYSGMEGGVNYSLDFSDKTFLKMSLQRSLITWWDNASSYYVGDSVSISPSWQISSKTVMHMVINHGINDYRGPVVPNTIARKDNTQSALLGIDWSPHRVVTLSASVQHSKRSSTPENYAGFGFNDNTASLSVQAYF